MPTPRDHDHHVAPGTPGSLPPRGRRRLRRNPIGLPSTEVRLDDVQALVCEDFGAMPETAYLLLRVNEAERRAAAEWLDWIAGEIRFATGDGQTVVNVAFTHAGLGKLGLDRDALAEFPEPFRHPDAERRAHRLGDEGASAPSSWRWGSPSNAVDVLVLLYAEEGCLAALVHEHVHRATTVGKLTAVVRPLQSTLADPPYRNREPFGFADGISQPAVHELNETASDAERPIATGEFLLGYPNEIGVYPVSPTVVTDRAAIGADLDPAPGADRSDIGRDGTYLVLRELEQDVLGFWDVAKARAQRKTAVGEPLAKWGAKLVGRWPGGAPLTLSPDVDDPALAQRNDFTYRADDERGLRCPMGAHIRRTNPRDALPHADEYHSLGFVRQHRIIRRGRSYGTPLAGWPDPDEMVKQRDPSTGRGTYFVCLNADLDQQFEFIQERWMNDPTFVNSKSGERDPLIDNQQPHAAFTVPADPVPDAIGGDGVRLSHFVTVQGGAYFFLPSRRTLTYLALKAAS